MTRRYAPEVPLPERAFVPGRERRSAHGRALEADAPLDPARWSDHRAWLHGVDLYNHGFFYEAHEVWESLWLGAGAGEPHRELLRGLIQWCAACLRLEMRSAAAFPALAHKSAERIAAAAHTAQGLPLGVDAGAFARAIEDFAARKPSTTEGRPALELQSKS